MGNEVNVQQTAKGLSFAVPAHIAAMIKAKGASNIPDRATTNQLTFAGKAWTMHVNGESKPVTRRLPLLDDENQPTGEFGEPEPVPVLEVIIVGWNQIKERKLYEGVWTGVSRQPDCWSNDGRKPHVSVENPRGVTCDTCPMSQKDSKINADGTGAVACSLSRTLVVVPSKNLDYSLLKMNLAVTSDWDAKDDESVANGWYAFKNYVEFLKNNGLSHSGAVVTKMRFAPGTPQKPINYPKVQFKMAGFLDEAQFDKVLARAGSEECVKLLAGFNPSAKPQGKPLPKDEDGEVTSSPAPTAQTPRPDPEVIKAAQELRAQEEAAAKATEIARLAEQETARKAEEQRVADQRAAKIAEAKRLLAEAEGEAFDDGAKAPVADTPTQTEEKAKRTRRSRAEMEAARAAEAAAKAPVRAVEHKVIDADPIIEKGLAATTASTGSPMEIPAELAAALPNWE
jgi:hypothetical protein